MCVVGDVLIPQTAYRLARSPPAPGSDGPKNGRACDHVSRPRVQAA